MLSLNNATKVIIGGKCPKKGVIFGPFRVIFGKTRLFSYLSHIDLQLFLKQ